MSEYRERRNQIMNSEQGQQMALEAMRTRLKIAKIKIVQGTSRIQNAQANAGKIYNTSTKQFVDEVAFIVVNTVDHRGMYPSIYDANAGQQCASPDGVFPYAQFIGNEVQRIALKEGHESFVDEIPDNCALCPFRTRGCNDRMTINAIDAMTLMPVSIMVERTKWGGVQPIVNESMMGDIFGIMTEPSVWYMTTLLEQSDGHSYYLPVVVKGELVSQYENAEQLDTIISAMRHSLMRKQEMDVSAMALGDGSENSHKYYPEQDAPEFFNELDNELDELDQLDG